MRARADAVRIADATNREFAQLVFIIKAAELLGFVDTALQMVFLSDIGQRFVEGRRRSARRSGANSS